MHTTATSAIFAAPHRRALAAAAWYPRAARTHWVFRIEGTVDRARLAAALDRTVHGFDVFGIALRAPEHRVARGAELAPATPTVRWIADLDIALDTTPGVDADTVRRARGLDAIRDHLADAAAPLELALVVCLAASREGVQWLGASVPGYAADAASAEPFVSRLAKEYGLDSSSTISPSGPAFHEVAEALQAAADAGDRAHGEAFWADHQPDAAPGPTLWSRPWMQPGPASYDASCHVPDEVIRQVAEVARVSGSPESVLLTMWAAFLGRSTSAVEIVCAVAATRRDEEALAEIVGPLSTWLPLRLRLARGQSLARATEAVGAALAEARIWQDFAPVSDVEAATQGLVPYGFRVVPPRGSRMTGGDIALAVEDADDPRPPHALVLSCERRADRVTLRITADAAVYSQADADRVADLFLHVLREACARPDAGLDTHAAVPDAERARLVEVFSRSGADRPPRRCVHELFEQRAADTPEAIAIVCDTESLTYRALNERANRAAWRLREDHGVGPDTLVGLLVERGLDLPVAILSVVKAGGAYVPLDPSYPDDRLAFMIADAGLSLVIASPALLSRARPHERAPIAGPMTAAAVRATVVSLDDLVASGAPIANPTCVTTPEHLAYVIYTSGSTGTPKASEVPHRSLPGFMCGVDYLPVRAGDRFLQFSSLSWDALTLELWPPLVHGATCVMYRGVLTIGDLGAAIRTHGITTLWLTATLFNAFAETTLDDLRDVRTLLVGGEALSPPHVRRALASLPDTRIVNGYGPSECTVFTSVQPLDDVLAAGASIPIGRPVGDREVYILDGAADLAPIGVSGELCVGGASLARGYRGRPALTAERFIPHPYAREAGARLYRTGDRARFREDGTLEFLGRLDQQVKVRGFRVEPAEIEQALRRHPGVAEAAVVARVRDGHVQHLAAFYLPGAGAQVGDADVMAHLRACLPEYMRPASVTALAAMPMTTTGKLDRAALIAMDERPAFGGEPAANEIEAALVDLWRDVLDQPAIGVTDNFFEAGGHSLAAAQAVARIRALFQVDVDPALVFAQPTARAFAAALEAAEPVRGQIATIAHLYHTVKRSPADASALVSAGGGA